MYININYVYIYAYYVCIYTCTFPYIFVQLFIFFYLSLMTAGNTPYRNTIPHPVMTVPGTDILTLLSLEPRKQSVQLDNLWTFTPTGSEDDCHEENYHHCLCCFICQGRNTHYTTNSSSTDENTLSPSKTFSHALHRKLRSVWSGFFRPGPGLK